MHIFWSVANKRKPKHIRKSFFSIVARFGFVGVVWHEPLFSSFQKNTFCIATLYEDYNKTERTVLRTSIPSSTSIYSYLHEQIVSS